MPHSPIFVPCSKLPCSELSLLISALNSSPAHPCSRSSHMQPTSTQGHWIPGGFPAVPWPSEAGWDSRSLGTPAHNPATPRRSRSAPLGLTMPPLPWGSIRDFPNALSGGRRPAQASTLGVRGQCGLQLSPDTLSKAHVPSAQTKAKGSVFPGSQGQLNPASLTREIQDFPKGKADIKKNKDTQNQGPWGGMGAELSGGQLPSPSQVNPPPGSCRS